MSEYRIYMIDGDHLLGWKGNKCKNVLELVKMSIELLKEEGWKIEYKEPKTEKGEKYITDDGECMFDVEVDRVPCNSFLHGIRLTLTYPEPEPVVDKCTANIGTDCDICDRDKPYCAHYKIKERLNKSVPDPQGDETEEAATNYIIPGHVPNLDEAEVGQDVQRNKLPRCPTCGQPEAVEIDGNGEIRIIRDEPEVDEWEKLKELCSDSLGVSEMKYLLRGLVKEIDKLRCPKGG